MCRKYITWKLKTILIVGISFVFLNPVVAADKRDMGGWESGSRYNKYYNAAEMDSFKGTILEIKEIVPLPGMSPGLALSVRDSDGETILVHLCPIWYENGKGLRLRKGDRVKVSGVWAEISDKEIFMGSKIKKNSYAFKVRLTKDGTPFWTMPPDQLAREKAATE